MAERLAQFGGGLFLNRAGTATASGSVACAPCLQQSIATHGAPAANPNLNLVIFGERYRALPILGMVAGEELETAASRLSIYTRASTEPPTSADGWLPTELLGVLHLPGP